MSWKVAIHRTIPEGSGSPGLLLGGVTCHRSSRFENYRDASDWAWQTVETNIGAGRAVGKVEIVWSDKPAEIPA